MSNVPRPGSVDFCRRPTTGIEYAPPGRGGQATQAIADVLTRGNQLNGPEKNLKMQHAPTQSYVRDREGQSKILRADGPAADQASSEEAGNVDDSRNVNILVVDDRPANLMALEAMLGGMDVNLVKAHSGLEALRCLLHDDFALILMDVQMPDMDGFETAEMIRERERCQATPIIFLTGVESADAQIFKGYSLGAVDYLVRNDILDKPTA